nr:hypothetical protein [Brucella intermedia]
MTLSPEFNAAIIAFNERTPSDDFKIDTDCCYWPSLQGDRESPKVFPSLNGLARLTIAEGNFLVEDHILGASHLNDDGFYGTSWMKSSLRNAVGLLSFIRKNGINTTGIEGCTDDPDSVFKMIDIVRVQRPEFRFSSNDKRILRLSTTIRMAINELANLTDANVAALRDYFEDYVDEAVSGLAYLTLSDHDQVWRDFGDHIAIEQGTRNLVIVINGVHLRQRPFLEAVAA